MPTINSAAPRAQKIQVGFSNNPLEYMFGVPKIDLDFGSGLIGSQASPVKYHGRRGNALTLNGVPIVRHGSFSVNGAPGFGTLTDPHTNVATAPKRTVMAQFKSEFKSGTGFKVLWGNTRAATDGWLMYHQRLSPGGDLRMIGIYGGGAMTFDKIHFRPTDQMTVFYIIDEPTSTFTVVINGQVDADQTLPGSYSTTLEPTQIGDAVGIGGFAYEGEIHRLMWWDHAMTTGQCQALTNILERNVSNVNGI